MFKTYYPKPEDLESQWLLVDADGQTLGRMASRISAILLGKGKPTVTPGVDTGDFVIVVNASKIHVTGDRLDQKMYYRHSGYPGGLRVIPLREQLKRAPEKVIRSAVWGMLPHNRYGRRLLKKMRVYSGPDHPHRPQKPVRIEISE
ncbi:MAG: 50S ribosomal protein L13 [Chloroflexi bacterium]|nr:50S ribosomal protein L13 [Chloroflexota bacterium]